MKFIIIGLGNFGSSLAVKLTAMGHEVIGADNKMEKVNAWKDHISHTICLDGTNPQAVDNLPLKDTDMVIIGIGENEGASIMATAVMKQHYTKRIISRAVSPTQSTVLEAMGIEEIIHPEEDAADRLAKKLNLKNVIDSFEVTSGYNIVESRVPKQYIGKSLEELGFMKEFQVVVLTTMSERKITNFLGHPKTVTEVKGVANSSTVFDEGDIMVLFGKMDNINKILEQE